MEILAIGKPAMNIYLPLQGFPQEGDIFTIKKPVESAGNVSLTVACMLGKWGEKAHFAGVMGNDSNADKIKVALNDNKVDIKHVENVYQVSTAANYIVLNTKNGMQSKVICNNPEMQLSKYKYEFRPDYALIDGTEIAGAHALINSNLDCKIFTYARVADHDSSAFSKRADYCICTQSFAEGLTKMTCNDAVEEYVNLFQKLVDVGGHSNYIVILNNRKILYSVNSQVKMLPAMKMNLADDSSFDSVFTGAFIYGIIHNLNVDDAIKFSDTAAAISSSRIGEVSAIPTLDEVCDNSGMRNKLETTPTNKSEEIAPETPAPLNPTHVEENNVAVDNNIATDNSNIAFGAPVQDSSSGVVENQELNEGASFFGQQPENVTPMQNTINQTNQMPQTPPIETPQNMGEYPQAQETMSMNTNQSVTEVNNQWLGETSLPPRETNMFDTNQNV